MKNNIRSGQLLTPFGIGQIINFPKELSLMVCGLDLWDEMIEHQKLKSGHNSIDENALLIREPRLEKILNVEFFRKPFEFTTSGLKNNYLKIPGVRFPRWHHCTNSKCGRMKEVELTLADGYVECSSCKSKMIPVRFIAACPKGHIQDVPFIEWVHNGKIIDNEIDHILSYHALPGSGDLGSILIRCTCGEKKSLAGLMNIRKSGKIVFDSALARIGLDKESSEKFSEENHNDNNINGQYCKGFRPWLGLEGIKNTQECGEHLQVLIRGGSSIHYSNIISALFLPEYSEEANEYAAKVITRISIEKLKFYYKKPDNLTVFNAIIETQKEVMDGLISAKDLSDQIIIEIEKYGEDETFGAVTEENLRIEEYQYILAGRNSENSDFKAIKKSFENYDEKFLLETYFDCVVLIEKLKETKVFKGFSRINPSNQINMDDLSTKKITWLPACEVYGEGIFIKFRDDKIDKWFDEYGILFNKNIERFHSAISKRKSDYINRDLNSSYIMMHTFAHLLIKRLCFSCGYGSSSLKERIYYSSDNQNRMNGILIYTSSGDSEGSLGGLVRQGKGPFLGKLIKDAIEDSRWCSADPVCSDIGQSSGQGPDNINGSACHNCCIVPETSCEEFNMLLDRATVSGTLDSDCGYFNKDS